MDIFRKNRAGRKERHAPEAGAEGQDVDQAMASAEGSGMDSESGRRLGTKSFVAAVGGLFRGLMVGDVLVSDLIQRQLLYIILVFVLSLWYINNRFLYERQLRELNKTKLELLDLKYRSLNLSKELMQAGRRTTVLKELEAQGSGLQEATSPIIIIKD